MPSGEHHNGFTPTISDHDHRTSSIDDGTGIFHRNDMPYLPYLFASGTYWFWTADGSPEIQTSTLSSSESSCKRIHLRYYALLSVSCVSAEFERLPDRPVDYTAVFVDISEAAGKEESVLDYTLLLRPSEPHDSSSSGSSSCSLCRPGCRQLISNPSDLILKSHVRDFSYICTPSEMVAAGADARDLERNSVSSGPILQAGAYSFKIIVAWSLAHDGSVTDYSMLGIAVQRVNGREDPVIMQLELRLVNRDPCQDIAMRSNIQPLRNTLGWYHSPYAMEREQADGFIPLRSVLDPATGWLVDGTLTVKCKMTVSFSGIESIPFLVGAKPDALVELGAQFGSLLDSGRLTDVVVKVGEEEIRVHSIILAARPPVLDAMWTTSMKEQAEKEATSAEMLSRWTSQPR